MNRRWLRVSTHRSTAISKSMRATVEGGRLMRIRCQTATVDSSISQSVFRSRPITIECRFRNNVRLKLSKLRSNLASQISRGISKSIELRPLKTCIGKTTTISNRSKTSRATVSSKERLKTSQMTANCQLLRSSKRIILSRRPIIIS